MSHSDTVFLFILAILGGLGFSYVTFIVGTYVGEREARRDEP